MLSIVVACFSGVASLITGLYGFGFWMTSRASMSTPATVVVGANGTPASANSQATAPGGGKSTTTLTEDQIVQVLNSAVRMSPAQFTDQQMGALRAELSKPNQQLVRPTNPTASFVNNMGGQTSASVGFDNGNVLIVDPDGHVTLSRPTPMKSGISESTTWVIMGEAAGSLALAVYLLVLGILVFRSSRSAPGLLGAYAVLKIPLALLAGAALAMLGSELASIGRGGGALSNVFMISAMIIAILGCAFPIALLIALHTRTVKDYFGSVAK